VIVRKTNTVNQASEPLPEPIFNLQVIPQEISQEIPVEPPVNVSANIESELLPATIIQPAIIEKPSEEQKPVEQIPTPEIPEYTEAELEQAAEKLKPKDQIEAEAQEKLVSLESKVEEPKPEESKPVETPKPKTIRKVIQHRGNNYPPVPFKYWKNQ